MQIMLTVAGKRKLIDVQAASEVKSTKKGKWVTFVTDENNDVIEVEESVQEVYREMRV